ncbi:ABC-F family ATP-binding cassette domain-containing protein [soil metagenome]
MLLSATITEKYMGSKLLLKDASFMMQENHKIALIGRNGAGKSTLFHLLTGDDTDFLGTIETPKKLRIVATAQEHHDFDTTTPVNYILDFIPEYYALQHIIDTYPDTMGDDMDKIHTFTEAIQTFTERNYYTVEEEIVQMLAGFDIDLDAAYRPMGSLSGGQKRFVELVKISFSQADLLLLDEPTNHLDYHGKAQFLSWLKKLNTAALIISHDRDVLREVNGVTELRDRQLFNFNGNYDAYIKQNGTSTVTQIGQYESALKRLEVLRKQMLTAKARMGGASTSRPRILYERLKGEHDELKASIVKPSFWIDKDTVESLSDTVTESYDKYKTRGITIRVAKPDTHVFQLLELEDVAVGYTHHLVERINFTIKHQERLQLRGRNGAGKSTLINAIMAAAVGKQPETLKKGEIKPSPKLRIGFYEQEISSEFLDMALGDAVSECYHKTNISIPIDEVRSILATYLFNPVNDIDLPVRQLSGGQKARLQLIKMLANNPNLLILDEPSNHLDLPSIEELEGALHAFTGAIIYVTHDSYFSESLGGRTIQVGRA